MGEGTKSGSARDNAYYLGRLEREAPDVFSDLNAGKIVSPAEAFRIAGLKRARTRLHELKNAWAKATEEDQKHFLSWLKATVPAASASDEVARGEVLVVDGRLTDDAKERIAAVLASRRIKPGAAMKEMDFSPLDPSLGLALRRDTLIRPKLEHQLARWLAHYERPEPHR